MDLHQPSRLARYNRAVVLDLIRRFGPISRSELAERSGLAPSSVLNIVASLTERELVRQGAVGRSTGGRRPFLVELNPGAHYAVGVNFRMPSVDAVLTDLVGDIVADTHLPLQRVADPAEVTSVVMEAVDQVIRMAHVDPALVLGAGVGCPGPVSEGRVVVGALSLPEWREVPLAQQLEGALGLPVMIENDANLGALAEYRYGAGSAPESVDSLVYVYADYGIGEGIILDGKLYRGFDGVAGELGHVVIDVDGPQCVCGSFGCLESLASISSVVRRVTMAVKLGGASKVPVHLDGKLDSLDFDSVREALMRGDPAARSAVDQALAYLAVGITNAIRQFRPQLVALGGELFSSGIDAYERLLPILTERAAFYGRPIPRVVVGRLGCQAPAIGGAALVLERFFGVPQEVMARDLQPTAREPAFDQPPVWPENAEDGVLLTPSKTAIAWAGNLQPVLSRIHGSEPVTVTVEVRLEDKDAVAQGEVKVLLHWDRVSQFGGRWPTPKNSPMRLVSVDGGRATYAVTLRSLPPGKYEFTAHVLGANDVWVRTDAQGEVNGRIEVLGHRPSATRRSGGSPERVPGDMEEIRMA